MYIYLHQAEDNLSVSPCVENHLFIYPYWVIFNNLFVICFYIFISSEASLQLPICCFFLYGLFMLYFIYRFILLFLLLLLIYYILYIEASLQLTCYCLLYSLFIIIFRCLFIDLLLFFIVAIIYYLIVEYYFRTL